MVFCRRNRKLTETALLSAAAKLFAQKGYENTRTLEIAKEAGANETLIGRYFGGKEGLLHAVLKDEFTSQSLMSSGQVACELEGLPPATEGHSLKEALRIFFKNGANVAQQKEAFMRIAISRSLLDSEMSKAVHERVIKQQLPKLVVSLKTYLVDSKLSKKEMEAMAMLIAGSNHMFNFLGKRIHEMDEKEADFALEVLIESLLSFVRNKN